MCCRRKSQKPRECLTRCVAETASHREKTEAPGSRGAREPRPALRLPENSRRTASPRAPRLPSSGADPEPRRLLASRSAGLPFFFILGKTFLIPCQHVNVLESPSPRGNPFARPGPHSPLAALRLAFRRSPFPVPAPSPSPALHTGAPSPRPSSRAPRASCVTCFNNSSFTCGSSASTHRARCRPYAPACAALVPRSLRPKPSPPPTARSGSAQH